MVFADSHPSFWALGFYLRGYREQLRSETELISLSSAKFRDVLSEYPKHMSFMRHGLGAADTS